MNLENRQQLANLYKTNYEMLFTEPSLRKETSKPKLVNQVNNINHNSVLKGKTMNLSSNKNESDKKIKINFALFSKQPSEKVINTYQTSVLTKNMEIKKKTSTEKVVKKPNIININNNLELRKTNTNANLFIDKSSSKNSIKLLR